MVNINQTDNYSSQNFNVAEYLQNLKKYYQLDNIDLLIKATHTTEKLTQGLTTFYGISYLELGLAIGKIILDLKLDQETAAAGILYSATAMLSPSSLSTIDTEMGTGISRLMLELQAINTISPLQTQQVRNALQSENLRNMLLAMATDIRVVIIKLAERLSIMRRIKEIAAEERKRFAQEILDIYAPLANRLGIGQIKWEMEDLAFRYIDPVAYKNIASLLAERRVNREERILKIINRLKEKLETAHLEIDIMGRAKHIFSIYNKMQRKNMDYANIYDQIAIRVIVKSIEDCYKVLSLAHELWTPITDKFDDYIAHPKPNGYRSIHTTVSDENNHHFEIQIRTSSMHDEAERGIAAHWQYKENQTFSKDTTERVSYLRQLLEWHKDILQFDLPAKNSQFVRDKIYVITPANDIFELPESATPLDFAYHVHSELGHRCRGAKVNGQIVPLSYSLHTGDKIEIITIPQGGPSRDWLNHELGYIKTTRAKNKIIHWFKQKDFVNDVEAGKTLLEKELLKHGINRSSSFQEIAKHFNLKNEDMLFAALNRGNIRLSQIIHIIHPKEEAKPLSILTSNKILPQQLTGSAIVGSADILTRFAKCCKPVPGDDIVGYITQGRGISIHKKNCLNANQFIHSDRKIEIEWEPAAILFFSTDLKIIAEERPGILNEISVLFANDKIDLLNFNSSFNKNQNIVIITVTIQVQNKEQLQQQIQRIQQLPGVIEVNRL